MQTKTKNRKNEKMFCLTSPAKRIRKNEKITLIECPRSFKINFPFSQNFLLFRQIYGNVTIERKIKKWI